MNVTRDDRRNCWAVYDLGRLFVIDKQLAEKGYRDYLQSVLASRRRAPYDPAVIPTRVSRLPTMHDFLEALATETWEAKGMTLPG